ncbi:MAG: GH92 family glycosyl hydrolase [Bacteroidetes bacterium]|nr:GH92 family glycosyl hydrolase [Bacteroidota bacterium]
MKKNIYIILILFCNLKILIAQIDYSQIVNPFIGTGGHGHTYPGATLPFGMVQLSPDTRIDGSWDGCSGYHFSDKKLYGFSHTHLSGTGVSDYGDILFAPTLTKPNLAGSQYSIGFSHENEKAFAGFYSVKLDDGIKVELTTTTRVGFHKYNFPSAKNNWIILDLSHRDKTIETKLNIVNKNEIEGMRRSDNWARDQHIYFVAQFSEPFVEEFGFEKNEIQILKRHAFKFNSTNIIFVKVGISTVSIEGARKNLNTELPHWNFDNVVEKSKNIWNNELSKIKVESNDKNKLTIFYTALYHTMIQPNVNMDVDGNYRGMDNKIHKADGFTYYTVFSLWDTFRAVHPLYTIIDRKRTLDFIKTFLAHYDQGGRLPVWELCSNETDCMIGYHSVSVINDAFQKGITNFDTNKALEAMKKSATWNHFGLPNYIKSGFLSIEDENESVSKTLEYAYDDWCIAQFAKSLNKIEDYKNYIQRAQSYKNIFDQKTGFMRPRLNGGWLTPFDAKEVNNNFTEANSWQYSFFVPQDIVGLISNFGGKENFENKLDELFYTSSNTTGREQADITGLIGQYAHGNEPSHHMAYLYNYIGNPGKTQFRVNQILKDFYKNSPDGLIGNEDCGQMSAWFVLSSIGIYQVCPGNNDFTLTSPFFNKIIIELENGKKTIINSDAKTEKDIYISKINNENNYILNYDDIQKGVILNFELTKSPPKVTDKFIFPKTEIIENKILVSPIIESTGKVFKNSSLIKISHPQNSKIYFTLDETIPNENSFIYTEPIHISKNTIIKAIALNKINLKSNIASASFHKFPNNWKITINSKYSNQYSAGGDDGIIDGLRGDINWRKGYWQGYQGTDFEAVIDFNEIKKISKINAGFLQDVRSWIFMPTKVLFEISKDGKLFSPIADINNTIPDTELNNQIKDFEIEFDKNISAKYLKIKAKNYGKLPFWHLGAGGDAYIFIDEISVQ